MSIKKARKTLQNKEKFNFGILDEVANSGGIKRSGGKRPEEETEERAGGKGRQEEAARSGRKKERKLANGPKIC